MASAIKKLVDIDLMFRAFSDPTRLRLLHLLQISSELCVCDLFTILDLPQPLVSRHLAYLKRAGLVTDKRVGQWKHYSLTVAECSFHSNLLCCVSKCFNEVPEFIKDAKRAAKILRSSQC
jgi:ArsR family transcriptional regulator